MLKDFGKSGNCDPFAVKKAHDHVEKLQQQLYAERGWRAIMVCFEAILTNLVNNALLDAIIAHLHGEKIKAFWARNIAYFHILDSPQDILHMILKSV